MVRVHRGGNRIDGVSHDNETFQVDLPVPKRSKIPMSFDRKLSFNMGELVPVLYLECIPGDAVHIAQAHNLMFAPTIAPLFHRIDYRTWYFFVPFRLLWKDWKEFICNNNPASVHPYFSPTALTAYQSANTLPDYFDLPVQVVGFQNCYADLNPFPFRAYVKIYNEFVRDEFKQSKVTEFDNGGNVTATEIATWQVRKIGWEKDYFTTCQVAPQLGADVLIPGTISADGNLKVSLANGNNPSPNSPVVTGAGTDRNFLTSQVDSSSLKYLSGLSLTGTINDLRYANHLQKYRDKLQIAGARYNEQILAEYGVVVPDYRIQRPEYIGGFASPVEIGRVMQQAQGTNPLGSYAGSLTGTGRMDYIHYYPEEHGCIIGLSCVVPRTGYDQGIPRHFYHTTLEAYYHPDFATLSDQAVYNDEIYVTAHATDTKGGRFGYTQRYQEYRYSNDRTNGEFRTSLSFWHLNREFSSLPVLGASFIECNPSDRIFAVQDGANKIYAEIYQQIDMVRPIPVSVVPTLDD